MKVEVNKQNKFLSQKYNLHKSLFEAQYESTTCDLKFLDVPGLTINIKIIPIFMFNDNFKEK